MARNSRYCARHLRRPALHERLVVRLGALLATGLAGLVPVVGVSAPAAYAATTLYADQRMAGDPACTTSEFPGFVVTTSALRQSFVPSRDGIAGFDLCLNILTAGTEFDVNVYSGGTPEAPGTPDEPGPVGTQHVSAGVGTGFVRVELPTEITANPGATYIIEIPPTQVTFQWRTTCGNTLIPCPANAPDRYPPGRTNFAGLGSQADFGFRSLTTKTADLTASLSAPAIICTGKALSGVVASVKNEGDTAVRASTATVRLSADNAITATDPLVADVPVPVLNPGQTANIVLPGGTTVPSGVTGRGFLGLVADSADVVVESAENNNVALAPTGVFCGPAKLTGLTLTGGGDIHTGAVRVPVDAVSAEIIGFAATGAESLPLKGLPLKGLPLKGLIPDSIADTPLKGLIPTGFYSALDAIHLSDIPVIGGWGPKLAGTIYADTPAQHIRLSQYLALPTGDVKVSELDLGRSPLRHVTFAAVASAGASLSDLAPNGPGTPPQAWCTVLAGGGWDCPTYGVNPATSTLFDLALEGITPAIDWSGTKASAMDLAGTPLSNVALSQYRIRQTPLRVLPQSAFNNPSTFVACSATVCPTLGDAEQLGQIKSGPTLGALIGDLKNKAASMGGMTLGDLLMGALPDKQYWPVGALSFAQAPLYAPTGESALQTLRVASTGTAPVVDPVVVVTPPPGFLVVPGSSKVVNPIGAAQRTVADPSSAGGAVTWRLTEVVDPGQTLTLTYQLVAGLTLGVAGSTAIVRAVDEFSPIQSAPLTNAAPLRVIDAEGLTGEADETAATAPLLAPRTRRIGHISSSGDVDYIRVPVPVGSECDTSGATGTPQSGCRLTFTLTSLATGAPVDLDLVAFGPEVDSVTQGLPLKGLPLKGLVNVELPRDEVGTTSDAAPETLQDLPLKGLPLKGLPLKGLSAQRGTSDESVDIVSSAGETGYYTLQVSGYNGTTSASAWVLSILTETPATPISCPPRVLGPGTPMLTPTVPADYTTLILVNAKRMSSIHGTETAQLLVDLQTFAQRPEVDGLVYPIDNDAAVAAAYADWDAAPCDIARVNTVVARINALIRTVSAGKSKFKYVVVSGSDDVIPQARVLDRTTLANESEYAQTLRAVHGDTPLSAAAAGKQFLTDDAYATDAPYDADGHPVFVPKWIVGRLVETPAQISYTIAQYTAAQGQAEQPPAQTALVTGYDFLNDGANDAASALEGKLAIDKVARLICESWTRADLLARLKGPALNTVTDCNDPTDPAPAADIALVNGHAEHDKLLPGDGNLTGQLNDLVTSADIDAALPPGRIVFGVGCHFGLNVPDSGARNPAVTGRLRDFAEAFSARAGVLIANTGFGYGDTLSNALSERLMTLFAERLATGGSVGAAFRDAKRAYFLEYMGAYGAFDEKVLQESVYYGLPHLTVGPAGAQPPTPPANTLTVDPISGLTVRAFDSGPLSYTSTTTNGETIHALGGRTLTVDQHPVVPQGVADVTNRDAAHPGKRALGLFLTSNGSPTVLTGYNPHFMRAEEDAGRPEPQSRGDFPTAPGAISDLGGDQRLMYWPGRFHPKSAPGAREVTGDLILDSRNQGVVYYGDPTLPLTRILRVDARWTDATHLALAVTTSGGDVRRVGIIVEGVFVEMQLTAPDYWTNTVTLAFNPSVDLIAQAVTPGGVAYWRNKGARVVPIASTSDGLEVHLSSAGEPQNGWYRGDVQVTLTGEGGGPLPVEVEYSLDGAAFQRYSGPVTVTGTGPHLFAGRGYDSQIPQQLFAAETVLVDVSTPSVTISSPLHSSEHPLNSTVIPAYSCADAGSGLMSCVGPATVNTSQPGTFTYTVTATDLAGNQQQSSVTYQVLPDTVLPTVSIVRPVNGAVYDYRTPITASYSCGDGGGAGLLSCVGSVPTGAVIDMTPGLQSFTVTARDGAGNTTSQTVTYTVKGNTFDGFYPGLANPPSVNTKLGGSALTVKFRVWEPDGVEIKQPNIPKYSWMTVSCTSPYGEITEKFPRTSTSKPAASYTSNQINYNAVTQKAWAGNCRRFIVTLPDKTTRELIVMFT